MASSSRSRSGSERDGAPLTGVNVTVSDLTGPGGATISPSNLTLYREHFVEVKRHSPYWGGPVHPLAGRWFPDALIPLVDPATGEPPAGGAIPAVPFDVEADHDQPVWVDVFVPRDAVAGDYAGSVHRHERSGECRRHDLAHRVGPHDAGRPVGGFGLPAVAQ